MQNSPEVHERSPAHAALGRGIRRMRDQLGSSQEELAHRCGLHRTYVGGIERGERNPTFGNLLKIAEALEVTMSGLMAAMERERDRDGLPSAPADDPVGQEAISQIPSQPAPAAFRRPLAGVQRR
jgi:transcriptional regulator with XRE-family HTH domain